jgi:hypothetical protein
VPGGENTAKEKCKKEEKKEISMLVWKWPQREGGRKGKRKVEK